MHVSVWLEYLRLNIFPEKKCSKWNCYFPVYPSESYRQASCEKQRVWPQVDSRLSSPFTLNLDGLKRKQMNLILREKDWWMVGMELWTVSGRRRTKDERRGQSCLGPQRMRLLWLLSEETRADLVFFFFYTGMSIADGHRPTDSDFSSKPKTEPHSRPPFQIAMASETPETTQCSNLYRKIAANQRPRILPPLHCRPIYCVIVCTV